MTRQVILHTGMAKTASTSMQGAFADNRPFLWAHGIDDPLSGRSGAFGRHDMIRSFIDGDIGAVDTCLDKGPRLDRGAIDDLYEGIPDHRRLKARA